MSNCKNCDHYDPCDYFLSGPEGCVEVCLKDCERFLNVLRDGEHCDGFEQNGSSASNCSDCGGNSNKGSVCRSVAKRLRRDLHLATGTADLAIKHRDDAERVIEEIREIVTHDHESKEAFIARVKACLPICPFSDNNQNEGN